MIQMADAGLDCMHVGRRRKPVTGSQAHNTSHQRAPGWDSLAAAVIEQAITDYFILVHAGMVRFGRRTGVKQGKKNNRRNGRVYMSYVVSGIPLTEVQSTIDFIHHDVARWATVCEMQSDNWQNLYNAIIMRERSGKHYFHHNSARGKIENANT